MKFGHNILFVLFAFCVHSLYAQTNRDYTITFHPIFGNSNFVLNDSVYKLNSGDSLRFETLKFYISGVELVSNDQSTWREENSFHLVDASDEKSLSILLHSIPNISFKQIKFNLGIDSATNVSGVMGGDLDPTK